MTGETIIAEWPKNGRETLRVRLDCFKEQPVIDLRSWYRGSDGTWKPGRGGLTVSTRHIPQLADAIAKAFATASASGLIAGNAPQTD